MSEWLFALWTLSTLLISTVVPLYIAVFGFASVVYLWQSHSCIIDNSTVHCILLGYNGTFHINLILLFFIYQFIIRGCFHKYIPSMLTRMGTGLVFALFGCIIQLLIHIYPSYDSLIITQQVLLGISFFSYYSHFI